MDLKDELVATLRSLDPQVDRTKAELELDDSAVAVASLLSEAQGLALVEYIADELECGKKPLYSANRFVERSQLEHLIERFYATGRVEALDVLLSFYHQIWVNRQGDSASEEFFRALKTIEGSAAIGSQTVAASVCLDCCLQLENAADICIHCGGNNSLQVSELLLTQPATTILRRGEYLEIYVKECIRKSGVELVGWPFDKQGRKAYISIRYQVEGEQIDIDVHGITQPLALLLCEVKTSRRILMNELRRVEDLLDRLIRKLNESSGRSFNHLKLFITTGEFDQNIPIGAYRRKNWELIDRASIPSLAKEFTRIQDEL